MARDKGKHEPPSTKGKPFAGAGTGKPKKKDIKMSFPNGIEMPRQTRALWLKWFQRSK